MSVIDFVCNVLFTRRFFLAISVLVVIFEIFANILIIQQVPYTEIDWKAYMQEVQGVLDGERNYLHLRGDTGPLVYPAGFVWIYQVLFYVTDNGSNIQLAQYIFMAIYIATLIVVLAIFKHTRMPPALLALLAVSKRMHSIFVLRLFNDTVAMLFAYTAIYAMVNSRSRHCVSRLSALLFSLGIAVKMNVQLMLPGAAFIWWRQGGLLAVTNQLLIIAVTQAALAAPFLATYPKEYLARAFDFARQFDYTWTVNWRFVGKDVFISQQWSIFLLSIHLALLATLWLVLWPRLSQNSAWSIIKSGLMRADKAQILVSPSSSSSNISTSSGAEEIITVIFMSNFVGIVCARSLHYQFYSWYFHMLPYLLYLAQLHPVILAATWFAIEYAWNVYPSTVFSSLTLLTAHVLLLAAVMYRMTLNPSSSSKAEAEEAKTKAKTKEKSKTV
ncbi:dolichyl-P-Man:Man(5)GlcNAc(2)-PP-dolichol alpha-1,3-mannosyltransferase [Coemansia asiatica]|uniref:Dol-P-Man:Man(5)GlcNAc(2)-PP-Dol alpha-1,3-mannosyltransferase n=1 Tax=Coemansia asiatica TaxID=1052880 RepID=A0A9W8CG10_9FUNG|nr:dolichyl-P-Man:Man(5)GlcNAc(2)-PP-dolichol alpha-1,3-mannosyltransferase [Coemansia asiatica]